MVLLKRTGDNIERAFEYDDAQRLLAMPNNGGWYLPEDSDYKLKGERLLKKQGKKQDGDS